MHPGELFPDDCSRIIRYERVSGPLPATIKSPGKGPPAFNWLAKLAVWDEMESQGDIAADRFPEDWKYYTLTFPVARYRRFGCVDIAREMETWDGIFYSRWKILRRAWHSFWQRRKPYATLVSNLSYRRSLRLSCQACRNFLPSRAPAQTS